MRLRPCDMEKVFEKDVQRDFQLSGAFALETLPVQPPTPPEDQLPVKKSERKRKKKSQEAPP